MALGAISRKLSPIISKSLMSTSDVTSANAGTYLVFAALAAVAPVAVGAAVAAAQVGCAATKLGDW